MGKKLIRSCFCCLPEEVDDGEGEDDDDGDGRSGVFLRLLTGGTGKNNAGKDRVVGKGELPIEVTN